MARGRIFENLIQNLPARTARENFRNFACLSGREQLFELPGLTSGDVTRWSHVQSTCGNTKEIRARATPRLPVAPRTADSLLCTYRASLSHKWDETSNQQPQTVTLTTDGNTPSRVKPTCMRRDQPPTTCRAFADFRKSFKNLPEWIKICLAKICLCLEKNPAPAQLGRPDHSAQCRVRMPVC